MEAETTETPWVSPEILAAQSGESVEMGKELRFPKPDRVQNAPKEDHTPPAVKRTVVLGDGVTEADNRTEN